MIENKRLQSNFLSPIQEKKEKLEIDNDNITHPLLDKELQSSGSHFCEQFIPNQLNQSEDDNPQEKQPEEKKIAVVTGLGQGGFDLDEIFTFDNKQTAGRQSKRLTIGKRFSRIFGDKTIDDDTEQFLYEKIPSFLAFYMLAQGIFISSITPAWIMSIGSNKILRIAWRFFMQAMVLIPLILYEHRTGTQKQKSAYNIKYMFQREHFSKLCISSLNASITITVSLVSQQWSYLIHAILLVQMPNFWLSIGRRMNNEKQHFVEQLGQFGCILGFAVISYDVITLNADELPETVFTDFLNSNVFQRNGWQRFFVGHVIPITCSFVMTKLSKHTADIKNIYPPFLSMFVISLLSTFHMMVLSYFVDGTNVDFDRFWGWFGIIKDGTLTHFMYISVMLTFAMLISQVFISKLFEPIVPAMASLIEPVGAQVFLHLGGVQQQPGPISFIGYMFILPGQLVIILGQHIFQKEKEFNEKLGTHQNNTQVNKQVGPSNKNLDEPRISSFKPRVSSVDFAKKSEEKRN